MITDEKVEKILKTLKTTKPPGPDGLHPRPQVEMANEIAEPFRELITRSVITSLFKKGNKHIPENYLHSM